MLLHKHAAMSHRKIIFNRGASSFELDVEIESSSAMAGRVVHRFHDEFVNPVVNRREKQQGLATLGGIR